MVKLVNTVDLKSIDLRLASSSLARGTKILKIMKKFEVVEKENATNVKVNGEVYVLFSDPFDEDHDRYSICIGEKHVDLDMITNVLGVQVEFLREITPLNVTTKFRVTVLENGNLMWSVDQFPKKPGVYTAVITEVLED